MIIDCISDLHGFYPQLPGGDLLIIAGDLTATHSIKELDYFNNWVLGLKYDKKILVAGNHDTFLESGVYDPFDVSTHNPNSVFVDPCLDYLLDSGTEYNGLKIWGSPWTLSFEGMNPKCKAFTCDTEEELDEKLKLIPKDVDILITHGPPCDLLDENVYGVLCGSMSLRDRLDDVLKPKIHVWGHIHEQGGKSLVYKRPGFGSENHTICVNASHVNENYQPVNGYKRIEL